MKHICEICGNEFDGHFNSKLCSDRCKNIKVIMTNNHLTYEEVKNIGLCECKICGYLGFNINSHIIKQHNMTIKEYCEKFNCSIRDVINEYAHNNIVNGQKQLQSNGYKTNFQTNNPGKEHGGTLSPFSRKFIKYQGLSEEEITHKINELKEKSKKHLIEHSNNSTQISYYLKKGYSIEEAKQLIKESQIKNTVNNKTEEEKQKIYNLKIEGLKRYQESQTELNLGYSKISQELFENICKDKRISKLEGIYYAINGPKLNNEYQITLYHPDSETESITLFLNFYIKSLNKCIEFDNEYLYSKEEMNKKDKLLSTLGIKVLRIKEKDYYKESDKITRKCIRWLLKK